MNTAYSFKPLSEYFWFWHQPESYASAYLEKSVWLFERTLQMSPRFATRLIGERASPIFDAGSVLPRFEALKPAAVLDFHLRLGYGDASVLFAWENLLDQRFSWRPGVPDTGRVFRWGFWWKFWD
jgi:hypothetical protein